MRLLFGDFETAYSTEYSLSRLTTAEYVMDPRFQTICVSLKSPGEPARCHWGADVQRALDAVDWTDTMFVSHHIKFDASVLAWRHGKRPKMYGCTMALAQIMTAPFCGSASLAETARYLRLPPKGHEVVNARGKWLDDFTDAERAAYMAYCDNDNELAAEIFRQLAPKLPRPEFEVVDALARMFVDPSLRFDPATLHQHLEEVEARKAELLFEAGLTDRAALMSNEQFATMLRDLGVEPPMKVSPTTGQTTYAFAKTDEAFTALLDEDGPVADLVNARLGHKTTIAGTRAQRFIDQSLLSPEHHAPVPLRYGAALTHRFGGTDKQNFQNLGRGSPLRRALVAPPGHSVLAVDASQIECRLLMWLAGQGEMLEAFAEKRDVYCEFATHIYDRKIEKAKHPTERMLGKVGVLSCGYSISGPVFRRAARMQSGGKIVLDDEAAQGVVNTYRRVNYMVPRLWRVADDFIPAIMGGTGLAHEVDGNIVFTAVRGALQGPGGLYMLYPNLRYHAERMEWIYDYGRTTGRRLFGAKIVENWCQHLARLVVTDAMLRIRHRTGRHACLQAHDELVYVMPTEECQAFSELAVEEMSRLPPWARSLPLAAEAHWGPTYADCK